MRKLLITIMALSCNAYAVDYQALSKLCDARSVSACKKIVLACRNKQGKGEPCFIYGNGLLRDKIKLQVAVGEIGLACDYGWKAACDQLRIAPKAKIKKPASVDYEQLVDECMAGNNKSCTISADACKKDNVDACTWIGGKMIQRNVNDPQGWSVVKYACKLGSEPACKWINEHTANLAQMNSLQRQIDSAQAANDQANPETNIRRANIINNFLNPPKPKQTNTNCQLNQRFGTMDCTTTEQ